MWQPAGWPVLTPRNRGSIRSNQRRTNQKQIALVTGASSGIGQATAEQLVAAGYKVYGTSRRGAHGNRSFEMLRLDVTDDESVTAVVSDVIGREGRIDLLVNNAGFSFGAAGAEESSIEQVQSIFDTNFFGVVRMTRAVLPHMREQNAGRIINIGSIVGFLPSPFMAFYAATKHAIEGYSESLDHEVRTWGIHVVVIEPAGTSTQIDANSTPADSQLDAYREAREIVGKKLSTMVEKGDSPSDVANVVLTAAVAARPKLRYLVGKQARKLRFLRTYAPVGLVDSALRKEMGLNALAKR